MRDHRIRLTDDDIALIVASLGARAAMAGDARFIRIRKLIERLSDGARGNPNLQRGIEWERGVLASDRRNRGVR